LVYIPKTRATRLLHSPEMGMIEAMQPAIIRPSMKRLLIISVVAVLSFVLGAGLVLFLKKATVPAGWIAIVPDREAVLFDEAAMKDDIPPPSAGKPEGRVKFLQHDKGIQIGYVLKLPIKPNPVSALPQKYRQETKLASGFVIGPPDQISYTGDFTFVLQDNDGFTLAKIKGPPERLTAASDNPIQGETEQTVPQSIAEHTKKIAVSFEAEKCDVCTW